MVAETFCEADVAGEKESILPLKNLFLKNLEYQRSPFIFYVKTQSLIIFFPPTFNEII